MAELAPAVVEARVGLAAADWRAAVVAACQPLVEAGAVEERYSDRCVRMVEEHGPYIVLAPGLALAHARPEDGVRTLCLAVTTLAEPVHFGHPDNDPVDLVFAFGSPDASRHVAMLQRLARSLMTGLDAELRSSGSDAEARRLLRGVAGGPA